MMLDLITRLPAILMAIAVGLIALWGFGQSKKKQGRAEIQDEMQDAYNSTRKDLDHEKSIRPTHPDAVLDGLHGYTKRGDGGGNT